MSAHPSATKTVVEPFQLFTVKQPTEEVEMVDASGRKHKEWRYQYFHFTTAPCPVTYNGTQYIPISGFDLIKWDELTA